jgi:hypothetical protein
VVDVTDRSDVDVRLGPLELGLGHLVSSSGLECWASGSWLPPDALRFGVYLL